MEPEWLDIDAICQSIIDHEVAIEDVKAILELSYEMEHPDALFSLAMWSLDNEFGFCKPTAECVQALEQSSTLGHPGASYNLGLLYELGSFASKDLRKARRFYCLAAIRGNEKGILEMADDSGICSKLSKEEIRSIFKSEAERISKLNS